MEKTQGKLGLEIVSNMDRITMDRIGKLAISNAKHNHQFIGRGKSLRFLAEELKSNTDHAIVIAAGPSLRKRQTIDQIKEASYSGTVIATESGLRYCLSNGIVPDLIVTLDPHVSRIVRWFGDPNLSEESLKKDDYFSRQDMDTDFANQLRANEELMDLLNKHGKNLNIALATSASEAVVSRVLEIGMNIYWWNPMFDDPEDTNGITYALRELNELPCVNAGGNVGSASWMMAHAVLGKQKVALTGMDFSYYSDTPYRNTQYYYEILNLVGEENLDSVYMRIFNSYLNEWFYTDPAYMWYRQIFLEMAKDADCTTYNCTEGGILFGDPIKFTTLKNFFREIGLKEPKLSKVGGKQNG